MKKILTSLLCALFAFASSTLANTPPTATVISATMRASTGIMDVVYRITDPDNPTVKVRALAFTDGIRSFSNVLRPVTFVEGTASSIGDAIATNTNHTLSWNVGADWNISLGNVKFEILARDARGLLAFDWISIPAVPGHAAVSVSKDTPSASAALDAFFWQYAAADPGLTLANGALSGSSTSGVFAGFPLVSGTTLQSYALPYLFKQDNRDFAPLEDVSYATTARAAILNPSSWHAANRNWAGITPVIGWGANWNGQTTIPLASPASSLSPHAARTTSLSRATAPSSAGATTATAKPPFLLASPASSPSP